MTLTVETGVPPSPSPQQAASCPSNQPSGSRRQYTVGSPTSSSKPVVYPPSQSSPQFLPLLPPSTELSPHPRSFSTEQRTNARGSSPSSRAIRRQVSASPERSGQHRSQGIGGSWLGNGRKNYGQQSGAKYILPTMAGRRNESGPPMTLSHTRPPFKNQRAGSSTQSNSLPSTPNHHPRQANGASRSPSPTSTLDSPRSAASEPLIPSIQKAPAVSPRTCIYETGLANIRRRMPYSLGIDKLGNEKPKAERLSVEQEGKFTEDIKGLFETLKPNQASGDRRRRFLEKLERLLNREWPGHDIQVHAFGSTENHLCMIDSDIDVCIKTSWDGLKSTCYLAARLAKCGMERVVCVPGAKVPIVKIWDPEYQVACDMNVNSTLALDNTKMIKTYVEIDERVRPLAMIIKHWTKKRVLNDAAGGGTLSSYTWICMILNFLQTRDPPILPALHQRPHKKRPPINGVDISFDDDIETLKGFGHNNKETLGELLFAFFKKYGHELDYEKKVISVRHGKLLSKEEKNWQYLQNNRLCVEEPFNFTRNLGNTADDSSVRGLHLEFRRAHKILSEDADLAAVCEQYEFPPGEPHTSVPIQQPAHRPVVTLSRGYPNHKSRGGYNNNRGNRPQHYMNGNRNGNRKPGNNNYNNHSNNVPLQHHYLSPEIFGYVQTPQEQLLALQTQFHHARVAQAQLAQAHAHAQLHGQQTQTQGSSASTNAHGSTLTPQDFAALGTLSSYAYFAQLWGMNYYYPSAPLHSELPTQMAPQAAIGMNESRQRAGQRRHNGYNGGSRSQSQPPPLSEVYSVPSYGRGGSSATGVTGSEDDDFADHSSSGNPVTPPEEEPDEYVGYYAYGGSLQSVPAVVDSVGEGEEPFIEQKSIVDRQSISLGGPGSFEDRGPVIVNGSISTSSVPYPDTPYSGLPLPSEELYQYDGSGRSGDKSLGSEATKNDTSSLAQKLLEVHIQAAVGGPEAGLTGSVQTQTYANAPSSASVSTSSLLSSPQNTQPSQVTSDDDVDTSVSPRLSPNLRQRAAREQLLWSNARVPPADNTNSKTAGTSQADLAPPLTPVPEVRSPSPAPAPISISIPAPVPASAKKESSSTLPPKSGHNGHSGRRSGRNHSAQVPPTPADKSSKSSGGSRGNGNSNNPKQNSGTKSDTKAFKMRKTKKRNSPKTNDSPPVNEVDRKGG
ncbi:hypothetical protein HOY80DRAFT_490445 [Tuber brumale]|nr:hypothetical protein HOY80DRAFT_490445 [Tuber brumale]